MLGFDNVIRYWAGCIVQDERTGLDEPRIRVVLGSSQTGNSQTFWLQCGARLISYLCYWPQ